MKILVLIGAIVIAIIIYGFVIALIVQSIKDKNKPKQQ